MIQKILQKPCLNINMPFNPVITERRKFKRIYKLNDAGSISLILKVPVSKLNQRLRNVFFMRAKKIIMR